jgi:hypothetical protein
MLYACTKGLHFVACTAVATSLGHDEVRVVGWLEGSDLYPSMRKPMAQKRTIMKEPTAIL